MKSLIKVFIFIVAMMNLSFGQEVSVQNDDGIASGHNYFTSRNGWEESVLLKPAGPCKVNKLYIYYYGDKKAIDTLHIVGFPTAGNLYPTEYIWDYNSLVEPVIYQYDGVPGWKTIDISKSGLRSDGYDQIVIQHKFNPNGPYFAKDAGGMKGLSWITDAFTPNANFYGIAGTLHYLSSGDYLVRLLVNYDFPNGETSFNPPPPKLVATDLISGGGYPSIVDWNKDGWDDIVLGGTLFENLKNGTFKSLASTNPINASGTAWGDIDNDGNIDCYAIANGSANFDKRMEYNNNRMYKNDGTKLIPINQKSVFNVPYPSTKTNFGTASDFNLDSLHNPFNAITPIFFDYNNDGNIDLFIANRRTEISGKPEMYSPDELWENDGTGKFNNVSIKSGVRAGEQYSPYDGANAFGYYDCYGAMAQDYNKDNKSDVFVANYRLIKDNLYSNNGNGTFNEVAAETGVQGLPTAADGYYGHGMGCQWGDFNNDGNPDLVIGNLAHTDSRGLYSNPSLIFQNNGAPNYDFKEVRKELGLKFHEGNAGSIWLDLDLDGNTDLWHGKYSGGIGSFYMNQGPPNYKFVEKTWDLDCVEQSPWVAVKTDFDNDGDWDIVVNGKLYRNDIVHKGKYLGLRLTGSPKDKINMDAYGTKVTVYAGGKKFYQELSGSSAGSLCTQNSNELIFGLGEVNKIDSTVIEYQNGKKNVINSLPLNGKYTIAYDGKIDQKMISTPSLVYPANNQINLPDSIYLKWNKVAGASTYKVHIRYTKDSDPYWLMELGDTAAWFKNVTGNSKTYFWTVEAKDINGKVTPKSSLWSFSCGKPTPSKINLLSPANKAEKISAKTKFIWNKAQFDILLSNEIVNYDLIILSSNLKDTIAIQKGLKDTSNQNAAVYKFAPNYKIYWKVCAYLENGSSVCSDVWEFTTMGLPGKITLTEPANNAIEASIKPYYKWLANDISSLYHLQVSTLADFSIIDFDKDSINSASYKQFKNQNGQTTYYWRVRGINDGGYGTWSDTWTYKTGGVSEVNEFERLENYINIDEIIPNPAKEKILIKINSKINDKITIFVINNIGLPIERIEKRVTEGMNNFELDLKERASGLYILKIEMNTLNATKPFLLIH